MSEKEMGIINPFQEKQPMCFMSFPAQAGPLMEGGIQQIAFLSPPCRKEKCPLWCAMDVETNRPGECAPSRIAALFMLAFFPEDDEEEMEEASI